jgi:hypothetical protein
LRPKSGKREVALWISREGKAGLYNEQSEPAAGVQTLLDDGVTVMGIDLLYQGEFLSDGEAPEKTRRVNNPREAAAYTFGYNHSLFAQRVHDILSLIALAKDHEGQPAQVDLVGLAGAGPWVAAARAQAGDAVRRTVVDTAGFRFAGVREIHHVDFLPGGAKYHDLPGMLALAAPHALWLAGEDDAGRKTVQTVYQATGAEQALTVYHGEDKDTLEAALQWLRAGQE